jgi:hypothetical protein
MASFINWSPDNGCVLNTKVPYILKKGHLVDRFGNDTGNFLGDAGDYYVYRSLPYFGSLDDNAVQNDLNFIRNAYMKTYNGKTQQYNPSYNYKQYVVLKDFVVEKCTIAPWFGFEGKATQYKTDEPISDLSNNGFLKLVPHEHPPFFDREHEEFHTEQVKAKTTTGGKKKKRYSRKRNKRRLTRTRKSRKSLSQKTHIKKNYHYCLSTPRTLSGRHFCRAAT